MPDASSPAPDDSERPEPKRNFYQSLKNRVENWDAKYGGKEKYSEFVPWAPPLFKLLWGLAEDGALPPRAQKKVDATITYFISPTDMVPEKMYGPPGFIDDIALAAYVVDEIASTVGEEVVRRNWERDEDVFNLVDRILDVAEEAVGQMAWKRIVDQISSDPTAESNSG